jgi:hypothetical protein
MGVTPWDRAVVSGALRRPPFPAREAAANDADAFGPMRQEFRGGNSRLFHELALNRVRQQLARWFPGAEVLIDRAGRRRQGGRVVMRARPDAQYDSPQRGQQRVFVEVDTTRGGMRRHIAAADPLARNVFLRIDPATGALLEQAVQAPGGALVPRLAPTGGFLRLRRQDFFDD